MKLCLCCNHPAADDAASCPKCGEASWAVHTPKAKPKSSAKRETPARADVEKTESEPEAVSVPKANRKARRSTKAEK